MIKSCLSGATIVHWLFVGCLDAPGPPFQYLTVCSLVTLVAAVAHCKYSWWMDLVHKELMHGGEIENSDMIPKQKRLSKLRSEVQVT